MIPILKRKRLEGQSSKVDCYRVLIQDLLLGAPCEMVLPMRGIHAPEHDHFYLLWPQMASKMVPWFPLLECMARVILDP